MGELGGESGFGESRGRGGAAQKTEDAAGVEFDVGIGALHKTRKGRGVVPTEYMENTVGSGAADGKGMWACNLLGYTNPNH